MFHFGNDKYNYIKAPFCFASLELAKRRKHLQNFMPVYFFFVDYDVLKKR